MSESYSHSLFQARVTFDDDAKAKAREPAWKASMAKQRSDQFAIFYAAYPRKKDPRLAERMFNQALKRASFETIMAGLRACQFPVNPRYIKHPASWLNADGWVGEVFTAVARHVAAGKTSWMDQYDGGAGMGQEAPAFSGVTIAGEVGDD